MPAPIDSILPVSEGLLSHPALLKKALKQAHFSYVFFDHLTQRNVSNVIKQAGLVNTLLNDIGRGGHMLVAVSMSRVPSDKQPAIRLKLRSKYVHAWAGDRGSFAEYIASRARRNGVASLI